MSPLRVDISLDYVQVHKQTWRLSANLMCTIL